MSTDAPQVESIAADSAHPSLLVDVVVCDSVDPTQLLAGVRALGAEARRWDSVLTWLETIPEYGGKLFDPLAMPDAIALMGDAGRMAMSRWVERARQTAPPALVIAGSQNTTAAHAAEFIRQGVGSIVLLPTPTERVTNDLVEPFRLLAESQEHRRRCAKHRKSLATLSRPEVEVLDLILDGLANKQIALKLNIGLRTVELRRSKIIRKMKAKSIAQLIRFVCEGRRY